MAQTRRPSAAARPLLRVVRGEPTPEELAALVAVVGAPALERRRAAGCARSAWSDPARLVRRPLVHGPGPCGWRS